MEIIDELEPRSAASMPARVGYFAADGAMDTCIALRTAVVKDGRCMCRPAAASSPTACRSEYQES